RLHRLHESSLLVRWDDETIVHGEGHDSDRAQGFEHDVLGEFTILAHQPRTSVRCDRPRDVRMLGLGGLEQPVSRFESIGDAVVAPECVGKRAHSAYMAPGVDGDQQSEPGLSPRRDVIRISWHLFTEFLIPQPNVQAPTVILRSGAAIDGDLVAAAAIFAGLVKAADLRSVLPKRVIEAAAVAKVGAVKNPKQLHLRAAAF